MFAVFSFVATVLIYMYVGETMGMTKKEKKALYIPGAPWGRKLKPGEQEPASPFPTKG